MQWFVIIGVICIVGGGVVAAISRPTEFGTGPWVAAYLVLVGGVAQIALGAGRALLDSEPPRIASTIIEVVAWNIGVAATIGGTLLASPVLTTIGGLATAAALVGFLTNLHRSPDIARWVTDAYRVFVAFVLLSVPIGLVLAWMRHG